ncbi:malate synthase A, partial [Paenibacillus sepulcri]|nr:malate synthase A [Paenibacillus sepulcri]
RGIGAVPINNLMEDAATAEISRAQVWQWIKHPQGVLSDGRRITVELTRTLIDEELQAIRTKIGESAYESGKFDVASRLFAEMSEAEDFEEFLTLPGYRYL